MQVKIKHLVLSLIGGGLGVLLIVVGLRLATSLALADDVALVGPSEGVLGTEAQGDFGWQTVLLDVYDGTYSDTYSIPRTITTTGAAPYQWGRTITGSLGFTDTLWCVQGGEGISLTGGVDPYTGSVDTIVSYGPIDLSHAVAAELQFSHWISVADGDGLQLGVSIDGIAFDFAPISPPTQGVWLSTTLNTDIFAPLKLLLDQPTVYVAFRFTSNDDGQVGPGVFLDDVHLQTRIQVESYMPVVYHSLPPTPTPTPPANYFADDFSDPTSGWPREWERKTQYENNRGGYMVDRPRAQILSELRQNAGPSMLDAEFSNWFLGLEDDVYYSVVHDAWDEVFISGSHQVEGDFVFEAKGRYDYVQDWFDGNRYGLLITREKVNPEDPHSVHGHCFYVEINPKTGGGFHTAGWGVKKWYRTNWRGDDNGDEDQFAKGPGTDSVIQSGLGKWNTFRIERKGSTLHFFINGMYFGSENNTDPGPLYIGLFARHAGSGATELSYDVLFEWDDVLVTP